jgi:hypothetical protein
MFRWFLQQHHCFLLVFAMRSRNGTAFPQCHSMFKVSAGLVLSFLFLATLQHVSNRNIQPFSRHVQLFFLRPRFLPERNINNFLSYMLSWNFHISRHRFVRVLSLCGRQVRLELRRQRLHHLRCWLVLQCPWFVRVLKLRCRPLPAVLRSHRMHGLRAWKVYKFNRGRRLRSVSSRVARFLSRQLSLLSMPERTLPTGPRTNGLRGLH